MRKSFLFLILFMAVLAVFFWVYFPALSRYRELKIQEEKLTHDISDLDGRIETLLEERKLLQNDLNYLEKVIREEMGLVKPGEIIYKMIPQALIKKSAPQQVDKPPAEPAKPPAPLAPAAAHTPPAARG